MNDFILIMIFIDLLVTVFLHFDLKHDIKIYIQEELKKNQNTDN